MQKWKAESGAASPRTLHLLPTLRQMGAGCAAAPVTLVKNPISVPVLMLLLWSRWDQDCTQEPKD